MIRLLLKLLLWNALFFGVIAVIIVNASSSAGIIGLSLPYILSIWLLFLGALYAERHIPVIIIAVIVSLLLAVQCVIYGVGILFSPYHFEHRTLFQLLLGISVITGLPFIWWFTRAKL